MMQRRRGPPQGEEPTDPSDVFAPFPGPPAGADRSKSGSLFLGMRCGIMRTNPGKENHVSDLRVAA